jgi:S-adenosylmethionine-diacylglycerol 3-amino-3-carboxypropyl transferase
MSCVTEKPPHAAGIQDRAEFHFVRYANCWEDADVLVAALQPGPGSRVLSIASAGDNALALLAEGAEVVAADLSLAQLACLELRCAAFRELDYEALLGFLGVREADGRLETYASLAGQLSPAARRFWDEHPPHVAVGIIHCGRFEEYFRVFRTRVLPLIHSRTTVSDLLQPRSAAERQQFWQQRWNNRRWRLLFRLFFSRFLLGRLGRDPEFFRYVEGSVSERIMNRARYGLTELPTHDNPFLTCIATGNFQSALPRYLRREHFEAIRSGLDRLSLFHGPIEEAARAHGAAGFDAFNLSDIFEYVDERTASTLYRELLDAARPSARLAYWNTLVPRSCPAELAHRVRPLDELSAELFARDKAFFYCHFQVDEVVEATVGDGLSSTAPL